MKELCIKISNGLYSWALDTYPGKGYREIFENGPKGGHGMEYGLYILLLVSLFFVVAFYYGVCARDADNATKKNYLTVLLLGMITLVFVNYVALTLLTGYYNTLFNMNMFAFNLLDLVYFVLLYQLWSWLLKDKSNAPNIDLYTILFKK